MSVRLMADVWEFGPDDPVESAVLLCLANFANDKGGNCYPGTPLIARMTRYSERTVIRAIKELESEAWITVVQRGGGRPKRGLEHSNKSEYRIILARFKECQAVSVSDVPARAVEKLEKVTLAAETCDFHAEKGDTRDNPPHPLLGRTVIDPPVIQTPPNPPLTQGARVVELPTPAIDHAADQVMSALGLAKPRLRKRIRAVIELEAEKGEPPPTIALDMIAAWREQARLGHLLHRKFGVMNFFELGMWKDKNSWHWNEELLRTRSQASIGSFK